MFDGDGMEEIKQLFFEESDEGLDAMEAGLLSLEAGEGNLDEINTIFRAAHSIKGGAATFAFTQVAEFTHSLETLLDEMRDGSRETTSGLVEVLLKAVDCVREMMASASEGDDIASSQSEQVGQEMAAILSNNTNPNTLSSAPVIVSVENTSPLQDYIGDMVGDDVLKGEAIPEVTNAAGWRISFKPHKDFLQLGNKPSLIFRELSSLGDLSVTSCIDNLPSLDDLNPTECFITWVLEVKGDISRESLDSVFDWVDDNCDLEFQSLTEPSPVILENTDQLNIQAASPSENLEGREVNVQPPEPIQPAPAAPAKANKNIPSSKKTTATKVKSSSSIRVDIDKIDALLNLVGELVITQSMLKKIGGEISGAVNDSLETGLSQLEANARELQEIAMNMRMLPINNTFNRFPRMVHDLCNKLSKKVDLQISGEHTELDKTVLEKVADPLLHLVRNALDHGIETPAERLAAGKPEVGVMKLSAAHEAGNIVISISDDGAGINPERVLAKARERGIVGEDEELSTEAINHLIFEAGFSTAEIVSDVSGRGVGMDVVRRNIQDLGGRVEIESEFGVGSVFKIRLPLTLAILDGQLVKVGEETYIIPLLSIVESVLIDMDRVNLVGAGAVFRLRAANIPIARVDKGLEGVSLASHNPMEGLENKILVIVDLGDQQIGLVVDELLDQQQVVIKSLETNYKQLKGLSGATILGDGMVALILDLAGLVEQSYHGKNDDCTRKRRLAAA